MSPSTAWVLRHIVRYRRFFGMPNLLHGKEVVREFLHDAATADALFQECRWMIEDERYRKKIAQAVSGCRLLLGETGASHRAALQIRKVLERSPSREANLVHAPA